MTEKQMAALLRRLVEDAGGDDLPTEICEIGVLRRDGFRILLDSGRAFDITVTEGRH